MSKSKYADTTNRLITIKAFIDSHYTEELRISELAATVGLTTSALCHFTKQNAGQTLISYVLSKRLSMAERELKKTTCSISNICYRCGFSTLSNFNRQFKRRNGCTPTEYRNKFITKNIKDE